MMFRKDAIELLSKYPSAIVTNALPKQS